MKIQNLAVSSVLLATCFITGCASTLLSDDRIKSNTAGVLGVTAEGMKISDRREEMPNTYYTATTKNGKKYACSINGGTLLDVGMTTPPTCSKK